MMMTRKLTTSASERQSLAKDYSVMGILGEGTWGKVKVALHLMTQTLVAIKILERGSITELFNVISTETELLKDLHHPHIVQLLQVIETKRKTYLVMECAARGSLLKLVTKCGHLEEEEARTLFRELTLAIKYIHSHNIAHRDIKAENVLLDWEGHIKLIDFGLGKRFTSGVKVKGFCGTIEYCAPEVLGDTQYEGLPTDIWSLGVLLFLLVTGHLPFSETERSKIKSQILSRNCCIPHHLSPELKDLLNRILTVDPTKRPSIVEVMAHPWLCHEEDTLISSAEIPREPDPNLAFQMFLMGYKIQEIQDALNQKEYTGAMATYLILQRKQRQHRIHYDGGQGDTTAPAKPLRRGTIAMLPGLPGEERKGCRAHSVPPTLSSLRSALPEKNLPQHQQMPHPKITTFKEIECSIESKSLSTTMKSLKYISWTVRSHENTQDLSIESSMMIDTISSWEPTSGRPSSCEPVLGDSIGNEYLQDSSPSSRETDPQETFKGQRAQVVPRIPLRQRVWKGLRKRVSQALRSLCCCLPLARRQSLGKIKIMPINQEDHRGRDTGEKK